MNTIFARSLSITACFLAFNISVPFGAVYTFGTPLREAVEKSRQAKPLKAVFESHPLTAKDQRALAGKSGENPYLAGQAKWDVVYKGVNMMTGNYTINATDLNFESSYGIPVDITRAYSANDANEGPFGKGWSLSADVRSTAGGVLKSKGSPNRSVPINFKERASTEQDPNIAVQPVEAVTAIDAGGKDETIQRDVDGVLTPPSWDQNKIVSRYEIVQANGNSYQLLASNQVTTPEGLVFAYAKEGSYINGGTKPWNNSAATPEPANVLKITSAKDRQGNVTTYSYGSGWVTFNKVDGQTQEHPLVSVQMPSGHTITLIWGDGSVGHPANRVWKVQDNNAIRTVTYGYDATGLLTTVTTPGGKTTTYGYGAAIASGDYPSVVASNLITSVTAPNGLTTSITYWMATTILYPNGVTLFGPLPYKVIQPDGKCTRFLYPGNGGSTHPVDSLYRSYSSHGSSFGMVETVGDSAGQILSRVCYYPTVSFGSYSLTCNNNPYDFNSAPYTPERPFEESTYSILDQSCIYDAVHTYKWAQGNYHGDGNEDAITLLATRQFGPSVSLPPQYTELANYPEYKCETVSQYNFIGKPLKSSATDYVKTTGSGSYTTQHTSSIDYAYWGADKYYQQKAIRDQSGRYAYNDYFDSAAPAGSKGQTKYVYDPKNAAFILDASVVVPSYTASGDAWKYQLKPSNPANYSATFGYDAKGRQTDSWKLQKTTTAPWTYVQTHTTYGGDSDGSWGQANSIIEDFGGINRTTQTLHYTSWGIPDKVQDASGHIFQTNFDVDGQVQSVARVDGGANQSIVSYVYGTTPGTLNFGQPVVITDGLSGVTQNITYQSVGGGIGKTSQVTESGGSNPSYTVSYTYNSAGDRETATYATPNGSQKWGYFDYVAVGQPAKAQRVFQTLCKLDSSGNRTAEELHYAYDSAGHLNEAAFAQTPKVGFTPGTGNPWYDSTDVASSRARAHYEYDFAGRLQTVAHYWDSWNSTSGSYQSESILANACAYETGGLNRGLKTSSAFYVRQSPGSAAWQLQRTESYGYDPQLDYLTSANYGDGLANATQAWSYDAAGNRNDAVCDNLNRALTVGGVTASYDILGNMWSKGGKQFLWDELNRLTTFNAGGGNGYMFYSYRADGMRVGKQSQTVQTTYRYDGQMGVEDVETTAGTTTVTDYGVGGRGVDYVQRTQASNVTTGFPIYDAHGNMVATISRSGAGYQVGDLRSYDAWGQIRSGNASGDPKGRYCASLGHKQDDESGLTYMRARYYDSSSGRFITQDSRMHSLNWYVYCGSDPIGRNDPSGKFFDLGVSSVEEAIEKLKEIQFADQCKLYAYNTITKIFQAYNAQILAYMGAFTGAFATSTGIEIEGEGGNMFIDIASHEAYMNGVHIDFQTAVGTILRLFESGAEFNDDVAGQSIFEALTGRGF